MPHTRSDAVLRWQPPGGTSGVQQLHYVWRYAGDPSTSWCAYDAPWRAVYGEGTGPDPVCRQDLATGVWASTCGVGSGDTWTPVSDWPRSCFDGTAGYRHQLAQVMGYPQDYAEIPAVTLSAAQGAPADWQWQPGAIDGTVVNAQAATLSWTWEPAGFVPAEMAVELLTPCASGLCVSRRFEPARTGNTATWRVDAWGLELAMEKYTARLVLNGSYGGHRVESEGVAVCAGLDNRCRTQVLYPRRPEQLAVSDLLPRTLYPGIDVQAPNFGQYAPDDAPVGAELEYRWNPAFIGQHAWTARVPPDTAVRLRLRSESGTLPPGLQVDGVSVVADGSGAAHAELTLSADGVGQFLISLSESGRSAFGRQESAALLELTLERQAADGTWSRPSHWMPSYLWVGLNRHLDGPASDPLRLVKAGRALLYEEGAVVSQPTADAFDSQAVAALESALNQVLPRKRSLSGQFTALLGERGRYDATVAAGVRLLSQGFHLAGQPNRGVYEPVGYTAPLLLDLRTQALISARERNPYLLQLHPHVRLWLQTAYGISASSVDGKAVDRWLLTGDEEHLDADLSAPLASAAAARLARLDGLLELSHNVVGRALSAMLRHGEDVYLNRADVSWLPVTPEHGAQTSSISYCFGCKDHYDQFAAFVASGCRGSDLSGYRGITNLATCGMTTDINQSVGLLTGRRDGWRTPQSYWTGTDCSGFVQRLANHIDESLANRPTGGVTPASVVAVGSLGFDLSLAVPWLGIRPNIGAHTIKGVPVGDAQGLNALTAQWMHDNHVCHPRPGCETLDRRLDLHHGTAIPAGQADAKVRNQHLKQMRPGDLLFYSSRGAVNHVAFFHSGPVDPVTGQPAPGFEDRPDCSSGTCRYRVLHASGDNQACYSVPGQTTPRCSFNRKVVVNEVNALLQSATLRNPIGFGRIKLWD